MAKYPTFTLDKTSWTKVDDLRTKNNILTIVTQGLTGFSISDDGTHIIANSNNKGIVYDDGSINFLGVRNDICDDSFNDSFYVYWVVSDESETAEYKKDLVCYKINQFTTKPGIASYYGINGTKTSNGVAVMCEGWQENIWMRGTHGGYRALRQTRDANQTIQTDPIKIYRDKTYYGKTDYNSFKYEGFIFGYLNFYDPPNKSNKEKISQTDARFTGINLHHSNAYFKAGVRDFVGTRSAGCQVFRNPNQFEELMNVIYNEECKLKQNKFSYFLTNQKVFDLLDNQIDEYYSNTTGVSFSDDESVRQSFPYKIYGYDKNESNIYSRCGVAQIGYSEHLGYDWDYQESIDPQTPSKAT